MLCIGRCRVCLFSVVVCGEFVFFFWMCVVRSFRDGFKGFVVLEASGGSPCVMFVCWSLGRLGGLWV